jgi:hypothetical protein
VDLRLALDQNFPKPILDALANYIRGVELRPVGDIDPRLPLADDWQLLLALSQKGFLVTVAAENGFNVKSQGPTTVLLSRTPPVLTMRATRTF